MFACCLRTFAILLGGGSSGGLMPNTAYCLEKMSHGGGGDGSADGRGGRDGAGKQEGGDKDANHIVVPVKATAATWVETLPPRLGRMVENALTMIRAVHLSILFSPVIALAPVLLQWDGGAAIWCGRDQLSSQIPEWESCHQVPSP